MRALPVVFLLAAALTSAPARAQTSPLTVTIGGAPVSFDRPPVEVAGRIYVPLRGIFERLGASVVYSAGHVNATKDQTTVALQSGSLTAAVNGQPLQLDGPPFVRDGRLFVPLRFVTQALGATVNYSAATQTIAITIPLPRGRRVLRFPQ